MRKRVLAAALAVFVIAGSELVCIEIAPNNRPKIIEYFSRHGYERVEEYAGRDIVNSYFRRGD